VDPSARGRRGSALVTITVMTVTAPVPASSEQVETVADIRPLGDTGAGTGLWLATGRLVPWDQIWPSLRHLDVR
jgi:hypothetical protein